MNRNHVAPMAMHLSVTIRASLCGFAFLLACFPPAVPAAEAAAKDQFESLKIGGTIVKNARITEATPTHVTIMFDGGGSRLKRKDLPPDLKALYPYDAKEAEAYEKEQEADREKRAAAERARQDRFNRELKASLLAQLPQAKARQDQFQKELNQLDREMEPIRSAAKGKPRSAARRELDALRERRAGLIHRLEEQKNLVDRINTQLDKL